MNAKDHDEAVPRGLPLSVPVTSVEFIGFSPLPQNWGMGWVQSLPVYFNQRTTPQRVHVIGVYKVFRLNSANEDPLVVPCHRFLPPIVAIGRSSLPART